MVPTSRIVALRRANDERHARRHARRRSMPRPASVTVASRTAEAPAHVERAGRPEHHAASIVQTNRIQLPDGGNVTHRRDLHARDASVRVRTARRAPDCARSRDHEHGRRGSQSGVLPPPPRLSSGGFRPSRSGTTSRLRALARVIERRPRAHRLKRAFDLPHGPAAARWCCRARRRARGASLPARRSFSSCVSHATLLFGAALPREVPRERLPLRVEIRRLRAIVCHAAQTPEWKVTLCSRPIPAPRSCSGRRTLDWSPMPGAQQRYVAVDESELLARLREGDEDAYASIFREHYSWLVVLSASRLLGDARSGRGSRAGRDAGAVAAERGAGARRSASRLPASVGAQSRAESSAARPDGAPVGAVRSPADRGTARRRARRVSRARRRRHARQWPSCRLRSVRCSR